MTRYDPPKSATYTPVKGKLAYPVLVLATRQAYGREEYEIQSPLGHATCWVTIDRLTFATAHEPLIPKSGSGSNDLTTDGREA